LTGSSPEAVATTKVSLIDRGSDRSTPLVTSSPGPCRLTRARRRRLLIGRQRLRSWTVGVLFEHKSAAGAVYRSVLRTEVRERLPWVAWSRVGCGLFEIDGVPGELLRHFS
jgi:hypothetical protein